MFAQPVAERVKVENVFKAACEYKIICDQAASDIRPFPLCSDANWGAGNMTIESTVLFLKANVTLYAAA